MVRSHLMVIPPFQNVYSCKEIFVRGQQNRLWRAGGRGVFRVGTEGQLSPPTEKEKGKKKERRRRNNGFFLICPHQKKILDTPLAGGGV